jgi:hypothetical protein
MADKKAKPKRVAVDVTQLDASLEELRELLGVPADVWARMPDSEKVLLFAQRGINASREALQKSKDAGQQ